MRKSFKVKGLDCASCAAKLEKSLNELPEVEKAVISFATGKLILHAADEKFEEAFEDVCALANKLEPDVEIEK